MGRQPVSGETFSSACSSSTAFWSLSGLPLCSLRSSAIFGWSLVRAFWPRAAARDRGCTSSRTKAVNRTIAAAAAVAPNRGWSRSARCWTRSAKTDMGEPSGGLVVPGVVRGGMTTRAGCPYRSESLRDGRREGVAGRSGAGATLGVGVALREEGRAAGAVADGRTDPGGRYGGRRARGDERTGGEGGAGRGGGGERDGGGEAAAVEQDD